MSIPDRVSLDPELPEQHLLRGGDRLQDYASAFLRGDITAVQYSEMTMAEINRRAPIHPLLRWGDPLDAPLESVPVKDVTPASPRVHERPPSSPVVAQAVPHRHSDADRALVLARAFVGGRIRSTDFLRLIRDC